MNNLNIEREPNTNKINVFNPNKKIGLFDPADMAQAFSWNGLEVIEFMLETLTECNYHTEVKQIRSILDKS